MTSRCHQPIAFCGEGLYSQPLVSFLLFPWSVRVLHTTWSIVYANKQMVGHCLNSLGPTLAPPITAFPLNSSSGLFPSLPPKVWSTHTLRWYCCHGPSASSSLLQMLHVPGALPLSYGKSIQIWGRHHPFFFLSPMSRLHVFLEGDLAIYIIRIHTVV